MHLSRKFLLFCNVVSVGGGGSSYAPYYAEASDWPATGISLLRLQSSDNGSIFQMPQSPFSGECRQSSPSARLTTLRTYENVPPTATQNTCVLRRHLTKSKKSTFDVKLKIESVQKILHLLSFCLLTV